MGGDELGWVPIKGRKKWWKLKPLLDRWFIQGSLAECEREFINGKFTDCSALEEESGQLELFRNVPVSWLIVEFKISWELSCKSPVWSVREIHESSSPEQAWGGEREGALLSSGAIIPELWDSGWGEIERFAALEARPSASTGWIFQTVESLVREEEDLPWSVCFLVLFLFWFVYILGRKFVHLRVIETS